MGMFDVVFVLVAVGFFLAARLFVAACEWL
jgi:hypothetical protein